MDELKLTHIFKKLRTTESEETGLFLFFQGDLLNELNKLNNENINSYNDLLNIYNIKNTNIFKTRLINQLKQINNFIIGKYKVENGNKLTLTPDTKFNNVLIDKIKIGQQVYMSTTSAPAPALVPAPGLALVPAPALASAPAPASAPASALNPDNPPDYLEYNVNNITDKIELTYKDKISKELIKNILPIPRSLNIYSTTTRGGSNKSLPGHTRHFTRKIKPSVNSL